MADTAEAVKPIPTIGRPERTYKFPDSVRLFDTDPKTITLRPITVREDLDASAIVRSKKGDDNLYAVEVLRKSTYKINGKVIDFSTEEPEWIERASPGVLKLAIKACSKMNSASAEEEELFFKSETGSSG